MTAEPRPGSGTPADERPNAAEDATWSCKIGPASRGDLPPGSDGPMREAVERAFRKLTGHDPEWTFSGWAHDLTEAERAVVEDRLPRPRVIAAAAREQMERAEAVIGTDLDPEPAPAAPVDAPTVGTPADERRRFTHIDSLDCRCGPERNTGHPDGRERIVHRAQFEDFAATAPAAPVDAPVLDEASVLADVLDWFENPQSRLTHKEVLERVRAALASPPLDVRKLPECGASNGGSFRCTLPVGHDGDHAQQAVIASWALAAADREEPTS